jgi:4-methyl-5(b-hydroxyethyl)-thiazole monophosphate biosynthesis
MKVLIPLAQGFEEIEFTTAVDILRRAGIDVVIAGLKPGLTEGRSKVKVMPDTTLDDVKLDDFDAIVLPGGSPGFVNLGNDSRVIKAVQDMDKAGKYVAAICGAPSVLVKAGVINGRRATIHPAGKDEVASCAQYVDERVVVDGKMITSKAAGTAMEFALKLVEILAGKEAVEKIKEDTLA